MFVAMLRVGESSKEFFFHNFTNQRMAKLNESKIVFKDQCHQYL